MKNTILSSFMIIGIFCFGLIPEKAEAKALTDSHSESDQPKKGCPYCNVRCQRYFWGTNTHKECGNCVRLNKCKDVSPMCPICKDTCFKKGIRDIGEGPKFMVAWHYVCGKCLTDHCVENPRKKKK